MSVPVLRFKQDDEQDFPEWEISSIGERINEKSSKFNPEKSIENYKCIELEHISQNTGELLGFISTDSSKSIKNKFQVGDVLFGKLRPYLRKFLKAPFDGVCSTEIWVLKGKGISNDYLFQFVQTEDFITQTNISSGSKMPRADWGVVSSATSYFPSLPEQTKIANFLTAVDEKITQLTQKHDLLAQYKKGVMQQIFSQELRFKDDDGQDFPEWEEEAIGRLFTIKAGGDISPSNVSAIKDDTYKYPIYSNSEKNAGLFGYTNQFKISDESITVTGRGSLGLAIPRYEPYYPIVRLLSLIPKFEFNVYFGAMAVNQLDIFVESTGVPQLTAPQISEYTITYPSVKEQNRIANFLTAIDDKITATNTQLQAVKQYKQGLLQQMFV